MGLKICQTKSASINQVGIVGTSKVHIIARNVINIADVKINPIIKIEFFILVLKNMKISQF